MEKLLLILLFPSAWHFYYIIIMFRETQVLLVSKLSVLLGPYSTRTDSFLRLHTRMHGRMDCIQVLLLYWLWLVHLTMSVRFAPLSPKLPIETAVYCSVRQPNSSCKPAFVSTVTWPVANLPHTAVKSSLDGLSLIFTVSMVSMPYMAEHSYSSRLWPLAMPDAVPQLNFIQSYAIVCMCCTCALCRVCGTDSAFPTVPQSANSMLMSHYTAVAVGWKMSDFHEGPRSAWTLLSLFPKGTAKFSDLCGRLCYWIAAIRHHPVHCSCCFRLVTTLETIRGHFPTTLRVDSFWHITLRGNWHTTSVLCLQ